MTGERADILVIDDELTVCRSCQRILHEDGCDVSIALGAYEGLERFREKDFDLVIVDLKMPDINGIEVVEAIKTEQPSTEVIIMTGYSTVASAVKGIKLGAADYIPKPFTPDEMSMAVKKALQHQEHNEAKRKGAGPLITKEAIIKEFVREQKKLAKKEGIYSSETDIAIIGVACRFPGASDYREFGDNLMQGINSIKEIPPSRWDSNEYYSPNFDEPNKSISKWCGLIDNIEKFDNHFFNISPREANNMDPQQRLLLEETWHCIENSGVSLSKLQKKITSVFVGVMATDYHQEASAPDVLVDSYACLGNYECVLANRISYVFGLQGPSIATDAACASSLVAIHEAKRSLTMRECDYSLASGVSLNFHPWKYISFSKSRMLSPDGQCKTFDINANG